MRRRETVSRWRLSRQLQLTMKATLFSKRPKAKAYLGEGMPSKTHQRAQEQIKSKKEQVRMRTQAKKKREKSKATIRNRRWTEDGECNGDSLAILSQLIYRPKSFRR